MSFNLAAWLTTLPSSVLIIESVLGAAWREQQQKRRPVQRSENFSFAKDDKTVIISATGVIDDSVLFRDTPAGEPCHSNRVTVWSDRWQSISATRLMERLPDVVSICLSLSLRSFTIKIEAAAMQFCSHCPVHHILCLSAFGYQKTGTRGTGWQGRLQSDTFKYHTTGRTGIFGIFTSSSNSAAQ